MPRKQSPSRTADQWIQLITECRQSGLSDAAWCEEHDIPRSTFYNTVSRLRKKACQIPEHSGNITSLDLTAPKEPVEIHLVNEPAAHITAPAEQEAVPHIDNSHMIEISIGPATIRVSNGSDPELLQAAVMAVGRLGHAR